MEDERPEEVEEQVVYVSGQEAARRLGTTSATVSRAARKARVGIVVEDGRLVAIAASDVEKLRHHIHGTPGNPDWIAAGKTRPHAPRARRPRRKTG